MEELEKENDEGYFGLGMDPTRADSVYAPIFDQESWFADSFTVSDPSTLLLRLPTRSHHLKVRSNDNESQDFQESPGERR